MQCVLSADCVMVCLRPVLCICAVCVPSNARYYGMRTGVVSHLCAMSCACVLLGDALCWCVRVLVAEIWLALPQLASGLVLRIPSAEWMTACGFSLSGTWGVTARKGGVGCTAFGSCSHW